MYVHCSTNTKKISNNYYDIIKICIDGVLMT